VKKSMPDFGTLRENEAAFEMAVASMNSGEIAWGCAILTALRDHILSTAKSKSTQWILPKVLETLDELTPCASTTTSHVR
jgi:hypothetical protein